VIGLSDLAHGARPGGDDSRPLRHGAWAGLLASVALLGICGDAKAQQTASSSGDPLQFEVRGRASYETNVAGGDPLVQAIRQVQPEDTSFELQTVASYRRETSRQSFQLSAAATARRYVENKNLDGEDYSAAAVVARTFGACSTTIGLNYARRQAQAEDLTLPVTENIVNQSGANGAVACGRRALLVSVSAQYGRVENDASGSGFIDSESVSVTGGLGYSTGPFGNLFLTVQYSESIYDLPTTMPVLASDGFRQYGGGFSYSRELGQRLSGTVAAAYVKIQTDGLESIDTDGVNATIDLAYRLSGRSRLAVNYGYNIQASKTINADFVRAHSLSLRGSYRVNSRVGLELSVTGAEENFEGGLPAPLQVRKNEHLTVGGSASWQIGRNILFSFEASHTERAADVSQFNFSSDRVSVGLAGTF
jgi:hypothetical protein